MSDSWIIGDVHGCYKSLLKVLEKISPSKDTSLYIVGDLINRGPESEKTLDFLINNPMKIQCILGNHDLAFISFYHKIFNKINEQDSYGQLTQNKNAVKWINWLRALPLCISNNEFTLVHAGLYPYWSLDENLQQADNLHHLLKSNNYVNELKKLWQHADSTQPKPYKSSFALNVFTRMRYISADRSLCLKTKGLTTDTTSKKKPWFELWPQQDKAIYFGHWSALRGETQREDIICLDSGCVWKESLTAINTSTGKKIIQPYAD